MGQDEFSLPHGLSVVTVFLDEARTPDYEAIVSRIAQIEPITVMPSQKGGFIIAWRGKAFSVEVDDYPLARHLYHEVASTSVFWPEAVTALARHKAVLTIGVFLPPGGLLDGLIEQAMLIRCFMDHLPVCGILWGSAALTKPDWFKFLVDRYHVNGRLPIPAWIKIQLTWNAHETIASTIGMQDFGLMEVECNPSPLAPDPTLDVLQYFIGYLMDQGPVVNDGNTIDLAEDMGAYDKPMRVHHAPSFRRNVGTVYLIDFTGFD